MNGENPAIRRTDKARPFAVTALLRPDTSAAAGPMTSGGAASADEIAWHRARHAVESCRRVAELAARR